MNRLYLFQFLSMSILLMSCNSKPMVLQQIVEEEQRDTIKSDHPITVMLYAELDSSEEYNDNILYDYWFKPHEASSVNIFFQKDNTYGLNYYRG